MTVSRLATHAQHARRPGLQAPDAPWRPAALASALASMLATLACTPAEARVTRIVIDEIKPLADAESGGLATEQLAGRAFGELDATAPANALINDVLLARDPDGKLR